MPFLGMHVEEGVTSSCGTCWAPGSGGCAVACSPFMAGFMELKHSERRQPKKRGRREGGEAHPERHLRPLLQCMNPDKFRNTNAYVDPAKFERAVGKSSVTNFELQIKEGFLAFVETLKTDRSKRPRAAALQAHDGEGLLPPHEEALPEDEAALHGHRLRDGADL